jgi:hydroxymethylglutaryl-CoA lyase
MVKMIECPRDAMQGLPEFIPTKKKAAYINKLLKVGFHTIDFGSFVSPKAIPQMRDTAAVLEQLELGSSSPKLLAIVANERGARDAAQFPQISYMGYPFSISETFQLRNTNATIEESLERVKAIYDIATRAGKELVVYISMGFGNPYGDEWNVEIVQKWAEKLVELGIRILSLSDTIGVANPASIKYLFSNLIPRFPEIEFGAHLHTEPKNWEEKVEAAYFSGCLRFDSAIKGYGGCPMAKDDLTGNMATENVFSFLEKHDIPNRVDREELLEAIELAASVFPLNAH